LADGTELLAMDLRRLQKVAEGSEHHSKPALLQCGLCGVGLFHRDEPTSNAQQIEAGRVENPAGTKPDCASRRKTRLSSEATIHPRLCANARQAASPIPRVCERSPRISSSSGSAIDSRKSTPRTSASSTRPAWSGFASSLSSLPHTTVARSLSTKQSGNGYRRRGAPCTSMRQRSIPRGRCCLGQPSVPGRARSSTSIWFASFTGALANCPPRSIVGCMTGWQLTKHTVRWWKS
jgi:hypothetical protein